MRILTTTLLAASLTLPLQTQAEGLAGSYLAARQAMLANDFSDASGYFERALSMDRANTDLIENYLIAQVGLGEIDESLDLARRLIETNPRSQIAQMVATSVSLNRGADTDLLIEMADTGRIGPLIDALLAAWGWLDVGDVGEGMEIFDALIASEEYIAFGIYHKALALGYVGDFEGSVSLLAGDDDNPGLRTARSMLALTQALSQLGRFEEARAVLADNFDLADPEVAAFYVPLSRDEALPFSMVTSPQDGMGAAFLSLASALQGQAADELTLVYARLAQYMAPQNADAAILVASVLEDLEQYDLATAAYDTVERSSPSYIRAEIGRAEALARADKTDTAIEVLMQLTEFAPTAPNVFAALGHTHRMNADFEAAAEAYDAAIALYPEQEPGQWFVYYTRGIAHERTDNWDEAEVDFRTSLELNPGQPSVLNYLGYSLVEQRRNLDEALEMIREAFEGRPDSGYIADSLGWVLYRLGRFDEAVEPMETAVSLRPIDPVINDHLGDVYWAVGRKREAEFQWSRALSFLEDEDDDHEAEPARIRRKLEVGLDIVLDEEGVPSLAEKAALAAERAANDDG